MYRRDFAPDQQHRLVWCGRIVLRESVGVYRAAAGGNSRLSGVNACGCIWGCPVCAAKITETRRKELVANMGRAGELGLSAYLMTLTFPHGREDDLAGLLKRQSKALIHFKNSRMYKDTMKAEKRLGSVRSLEVTFGEENGWHPHTHDLVFCAGNLAAHLDTMKAQWFKSLKHAGIATDSQVNDVLEHGLDIRGGAYAAAYVAKYGHELAQEGWGMSGELTKSHAKLGMRSGRYSPFQLLQFAGNGDAKAAALYREFVLCFDGKRMLSYSPKLKAQLGQADLSDEVLAAMETPLPDEQFAGSISVEDYHEVVRRDAVFELMDYAASCLTDQDTAQDDLNDWIAWLKTTPAHHGGALRQRRHFAPGTMEIYGHA
jgi:hypothetical protein